MYLLLHFLSYRKGKIQKEEKGGDTSEEAMRDG